MNIIFPNFSFTSVYGQVDVRKTICYHDQALIGHLCQVLFNFLTKSPYRHLMISEMAFICDVKKEKINTSILKFNSLSKEPITID